MAKMFGAGFLLYPSGLGLIGRAKVSGLRADEKTSLARRLQTASGETAATIEARLAVNIRRATSGVVGA